MTALVLLSLLAQNLRGDEALSKVLLDGEGWQAVGSGYQFTDAACPGPDGSFYFSDLPAGVVHRVGPDGKPAPWWTGAPRISGMKFGPDGRLYAATQAPRKQIIAVTPATKAVAVIADGVQPNDLIVTRKGHVYFTDTAAGNVMVVDPQRRVRVAASGVAKPNGLVLSPDGGTLAVSEYGGAHVWAFRVEPDGNLTFGAPWMDLRTPVGRTDSGGDGMTIDEEGRFYVTSLVGVQMFDWTGRMGGVIANPPGKSVVSAAFVGPYLYACATDKVYRRKMKAHAAP